MAYVFLSSTYFPMLLKYRQIYVCVCKCDCIDLFYGCGRVCASLTIVGFDNYIMVSSVRATSTTTVWPVMNVLLITARSVMGSESVSMVSVSATREEEESRVNYGAQGMLYC